MFTCSFHARPLFINFRRHGRMVSTRSVEPLCLRRLCFSTSLFQHKLAERWRLVVSEYLENAIVKPLRAFDSSGINHCNKCAHACQFKTKCNYFIKNYIRHGHHGGLEYYCSTRMPHTANPTQYTLPTCKLKLGSPIIYISINIGIHDSN